MESLRRDVRLAIRLLLKQPGFSLLAVSTLALGIGLSTALFSVLDAAFIRPLPYPNPEQLVGINVQELLPTGERVGLSPSVHDVEDWRAHGQVFSHLAVSRSAFSDPLILDGDEPLRLQAERVSKDYFGMYGVTPMLGRTFTDEEHAPGGPAVVLLGFDFWKTRFGGVRDIVGGTIRLNSEPMTVVGVLPSWFYAETKVWRPFDASRDSFGKQRGSGASVEGRLRPGMSIADAERVLTAVSARAAESRGGRASPVELTSMYESATRSNVQAARVLAYAVGLVLLLGCVNVAGLLLARGAVRAPELAVRASLGAGRTRLLRQLLTESLVLAVCGAALGVFLAWIALDLLVANTPMFLPGNAPVEINLKALVFAVGAAAITALLFGLVPAWRMSRVSAGDALARAGRGHASTLPQRTGQALIAVEVAVAIVLLAGAGLLLRSFTRVMAVDLGFEPDAVLAMEVSPATPGRAAQAEYYPALIERLRTHPGVAAVGAVDYPPLIGGSRYTSASAPGRTAGSVGVRQYLGDFFAAIAPTLREGRLPAAADAGRGVPLAVINESARKALFGDERPIGRPIVIRENTYEVAGVIADIRHSGPLSDARPEVWYPFDANDQRGRALVVIVRPRGTAAIGLADLRQAAHAVGRTVVVEKVARGSSWLADRVATPRRRTVLLGVLGALGLLLALVGVFGITAYAVARRTQEIGVRLAFGATPRDVVGAAVRASAIPVMAGIAAGLLASWWATRAIQSFLFETEPRDLATFASVAIMLAVTACIAAWIPARRAARVDPMVALRAE